MPAVKITVLRCLTTEDALGGVDAQCTLAGASCCPAFSGGEVFLAEYDAMPEGFCPGAWTDLFRFVLALQSGADFPWIKEPGKVLACCNDGFKPVIFRLERVEKGASDEP